VDRFFGIYDNRDRPFAKAGCQPTTLLGVTRLASPEVLVEIEATAVL
jgi:enamine deaminase RidA (YjgF/YER057c/UK114 family)